MAIENIREGSSVIRQFVTLSFVALSPPSHAIFKSSEISNSVYSDIYLKVRQVFLETINFTMVVMLLSSYPLDLWTVIWTSSGP